MSRTFDHDLYIFSQARRVSSPSVRSSSSCDTSVASSRQPGRQASPRLKGHVVFLTDIEQAVKMLIEWVLLSGHFHPCKDNGTAAGRRCWSGVSFLKRSAVFLLIPTWIVRKSTPSFAHFRDLQPFFRCDFTQWLVINHSVIDRHGSDDGRALGCQLAAELRVSPNELKSMIDSAPMATASLTF